jgi:hypothetical protein
LKKEDNDALNNREKIINLKLELVEVLVLVKVKLLEEV